MIASVNNIKVNNSVASQQVRITDPFPTFSFTFDSTPHIVASDPPGAIADVDTLTIDNFEIRVGTNSTLHGTDFFDGNIVDITVNSSNPVWRYKGTALSRGTTYYGQIRATDNLSNVTAWTTFSFKYNSLPIVTNLAILPANPTVHDALTINEYTFTDSDGDNEQGSIIWWYKNGVHQRHLDGQTTIESKYLAYGDQWSVQVTPNDGYEFGASVSSPKINVTTEIPVASNLTIEPVNPTYLDPLYAKYTYSSTTQTNKSEIQWYLNGTPVTKATSAFARFETKVGDVVHYEIQPYDGVSRGDWIACTPITIQAPKFRVANLRVQNESEPLSVTSLTPTISWESVGPSTTPTQFRVKIGTAPGASNALDLTVQSADEFFTVPVNSLSKGTDYYASVSVGDANGFGEASIVHFRTAGSRWHETVSNSTGWTIETIVKVTPEPQTSSSSSSSSSSSVPRAAYHGIRIFDGTKSAEIRLYHNKISVVSAGVVEESTSLTDFALITITGKGSDIKVYQNYALLIDGTGLLSQITSTNEKYIEFGSLTGQAKGEYQNFFYTTEGAFEPGLGNSTLPGHPNPYNALDYVVYYDSGGSIDYITAANGTMYFAASDDDSSVIYRVTNEQPVKVTGVSRAFLDVYRIATFGKYTFICHKAGATAITNHAVPSYDSSANFKDHEEPVDKQWSLTAASLASSSFTQDGLLIDTVTDGGAYFYSQGLPGTKWFDNVDNKKGWTVDFSLTVDAISDDNSGSPSAPDGCGVYVNDGTRHETVYFLPSEIVLKNANKHIPFDTTSETEYSIIGQDNNIRVFAKKSTESVKSLIGEANLIFKASNEGNAGRPFIYENPQTAELHAVWHDDGAGFRQIYYSKGVVDLSKDEYNRPNDTSVRWSSPELIVLEKYGASNPCLVMDTNGNIYVTYESERNDSTDIGMVVRNQYGWSNPYIISSGIHASKSPKIAVDAANNIHVVFEDHRNNTPQIYHIARSAISGKWSEPKQISNGQYGCVRPSLDIRGMTPAVSFTQFRADGSSTIYLTTLLLYTEIDWPSLDADDWFYLDVAFLMGYMGSWVPPVCVFPNGRDSDYSDVCQTYASVFVTWQDSQANGNYEIYVRHFNPLLIATQSPVRLTNDMDSSRFPSIGVRTGFDDKTGNVYIVWESGGDISPYEYHGDYTSTTTEIRSAYYNHSIGRWISNTNTYSINSQTYGGYNTAFVFSDLRTARRPRIQKHFAYSAHIVYETESVVLNGNLSTAAGFTAVRDAVYDLSSSQTYSIYSDTDLQISSKLPRKEIRFGDFSSTLNGRYTFGHFDYYAQAAVEPYSISLVSDKTTSITKNKCFDAVINENGDAWIANEGGLLYYFAKTGEIAKVPVTYEFHDISPINALAFDKNSVLYIATDSGIYVSVDHRNFSKLTINQTSSSTSCAVTQIPNKVNDIAITTTNILWGATDSGLISIDLNNITIADSSTTNTAITTVTGSSARLFNTACSALLTDVIKKVVVDSNNIAWAATDNGLVSVKNWAVKVYTTKNSSIPSDKINDISIRNGAIRYVATAEGLIKMTGEFEKISLSDPLWNDNVVAVGWKEPNILWASCGSNVFEIAVDSNLDYTSIRYEPYDYALTLPGECNLPRIYRFDGYNEDRLSEVYVNGRKVKHGFMISNKGVAFDSPLLPSDKVEIVIRNDIAPFATLKQNIAELMAYGQITRNVHKFLTNGTVLYAAIMNGADQLASYDTTDAYVMPYDKIGLDTTAPTATLRYIRQLTAREVEVAIDGATDNLSGIEGMIVSNYPNFTTDGVTTQEFAPFADTYVHNLGFDLGNTSDEILFSDTHGTRLVSFADVPYAGTSSPAKILRYSSISNLWATSAELDSDDADAGVDFLVVYKNVLVAGTGSDAVGGSGKIFISANGSDFTTSVILSASRATAAAEVNGILYIGTNNGRLYSYNGSTVKTIRTSNSDSAPILQIGSYIHAMAGLNGSLYIATGASPTATTGQGTLYRFDPITLSLQIIYLDPDIRLTSVSAMAVDKADSTTGEQDIYVFTGTGTTGRVMRSLNDNPFVLSYAGLSGKVVASKIFNDHMYIAINKSIYKYNKGWVALPATHSEPITDFLIGPDIDVGQNRPARNDITVISSSKITKTRGQIATKTIYLSLRDVAGNATREPGSDGSDGSTVISTDISIDDLNNFINEKRIVEIDETGKTVFAYDGKKPFYSADKVTVEQGEYYSEIFNGTNDHVAWDTIYWDASVPDGTDLTIAIRTADYRSQLLLQEFDKVFTKEQFTGADLSNISGKYIQFKATLSTTVRNKSPKLYKVVIRSKTRASVHFFTTNFILPSKMTSGILTAETYLPVAADIVFGINTNDSVDFSDYQIIQPNRVFALDSSQIGQNMRIGVKLISPLPQSTETDFVTELDPYSNPLYTNVIDFKYTNTSGSTKTFNFKVEFYNDALFTDKQATLYTMSSTEGWSYDNTAFPSGGLTMTAGSTSSILLSASGSAAVRCNEYYYVKIYVYDGSSFTLVSDNHSFTATCYPTSIDVINFDFTNKTLSSGTYHFRVRVFEDEARTVQLENFFSGLNQTGWYANGIPITAPGVTVASGDTVSVEVAPDLSNLDSRYTYYLAIDYYDGSAFNTLSNSYTLKATQSTDFGCSEYVNVPVLKDMGILFDLAEYTDEFGKTRRTVLLNI